MRVLRNMASLIEIRLDLFLSALEEVEGLESGDAVLILKLSARPEWLADVWSEAETNDREVFAKAVEHLTDYTMVWCEDCNSPVWDDESTTTAAGAVICESCRDNSYVCCEACDEYYRDYNVTYVGNSTYCDDNCLGEYCTFCDECDEYYHDDYSDDHAHGGCECDAPRPRFSFPANGRGTVSQNERLQVELPAGTISPEGIYEVWMAVAGANLRNSDGTLVSAYDVRKLVEGLEPEWQKKSGNFTKRLSKALYTELKVKMPAAVISGVGNIARQHTTTVSSHWVEFTRNLNGSAEEFCNEDSCWWGGYSYSRCSLKSWGGIGLRSYCSEHDDTYCPRGRAWVQPLDADMRPTHDTMGAHAYLVYNGYGNMDGYTPARIVAHLTGRTYRKVAVSLRPQYVNNSNGYLVADEATCNKVDSITFEADQHDTLDHTTLEVAAA